MLSYALRAQEGPLPAVHLWEGGQLSSSPQDGAQAAGHSNSSGPAGGPEKHTGVRRLGSIKRKHLIHQMTMGTSEGEQLRQGKPGTKAGVR